MLFHSLELDLLIIGEHIKNVLNIIVLLVIFFVDSKI